MRFFERRHDGSLDITKEGAHWLGWSLVACLVTGGPLGAAPLLTLIAGKTTAASLRGLGRATRSSARALKRRSEEAAERRRIAALPRPTPPPTREDVIALIQGTYEADIRRIATLPIPEADRELLLQFRREKLIGDITSLME